YAVSLYSLISSSFTCVIFNIFSLTNIFLSKVTLLSFGCIHLEKLNLIDVSI
ncbi:hypothetical protein Leryth_020534, partial [Lithospermum erythrorhizon]